MDVKDKIEELQSLIESLNLTSQQKLNKIIQALQKTEDIMKTKVLATQIQNGDFSNLQEKAIDNLIKAFYNTKEENKNEITNKEKEKIENENKLLKEQLEFAEQRYKKLQEIIALTNTAELIIVPDEDINDLNVEYLKNNNVDHYKKAFIINGIIPKSYYKIVNKS